MTDTDNTGWLAVPGGTTRRYYADSPLSYALAVIALTEYARDTRDSNFSYGPLDSQAMIRGGLFISGKNLAGPAAVLADIPGLSWHEDPVMAPD